MRDNDIMKIIGNNIRAERNRLGWSQDDFAEKSGLQREHISKIERGIIDMRVTSTLIPILKALNLKFEKIYDINENND